MKQIFIADKTITVRTIKVKDLPAVCMAVEPFIDKFGQITKNGGLKNGDLFKLCAMHSSDVVNLCAVLTDLSRDELMELEPLELFTITKEVMILSHDFFLNQVFEPVEQLANHMMMLALTMK